MMRRNLSFVLLSLAFAPAAFAAGEMPGFFTEIVCMVLVCAVMGYLCYRLGLVPILGFLFTGVVLNATGLVSDPRLVEAMAEVGVILLLFTIGIEFSIESLMRIRRLIFLGGGLQVGLTTGLVYAAVMILGGDWRSALFTGLLVSLSSTAIVLKLLESRGETRTEPGQIGVGMLIFQDLAVVGMVIAVPLLGGEGGSDKLLGLAKAVVLVGAVLWVARKLVPKLLEALARACSQEVFLLGVIAICLGTAFVTGFAGISLSLGAFLAGLLVSESRFGSQALGEILPLQILFSATFFVSVGLLLDVRFLIANLGLVLAVVAVVLVLKAVVVAGTARALGFAVGPSLAAGLLLAQVGEFSFVLERAGRTVGLLPAGLETGGQTFIAATVLLMAITPFLAQAGSALDRRLQRKALPARAASATAEAPVARLTDHVLVLGYGRSGRWLVAQLLAAEAPVQVITLSPTGATEAEARGARVLRGDYTKLHLLEEGGLRSARLVVISDDTLEMAERTLQLLRATTPDVPVLVKTTLHDDARTLAALGATFAVSEEELGHQALLAQVLSTAGLEVADTEALEIIADDQETPMSNTAMSFTLTPEQQSSSACSHLDQVRSITADATDVCPQCVASGDRWVHLRVCMTCGQVGCCDSSKNRHARNHAESSEHPIIRSIEPGETWAWCFVDDAML